MFFLIRIFVCATDVPKCGFCVIVIQFDAIFREESFQCFIEAICQVDDTAFYKHVVCNDDVTLVAIHAGF